MRVAIVTHDVARGDGQGRVNYELARAALAAGHSIRLLADRVDPELISAGATWVPIRPQLRHPNLLKVREFIWRADAALASLAGQVDIVHANGGVLSGPHEVNTVHFVHAAWLRSPAHTARLRRDPYGFYHGLYTWLNARWERCAFARARTVVAVSDKVRAELEAIGVPPERLRVIWNGVDLEEFRPGPADRRTLGLPETGPLALFVGDIRTPLKNLDTLLQALAQVPRLALAVCGDPTGSPYPRLAAELGLAERVRFLGYRADVPQLMRAADLFVLPSRYESSSLVVLEALASGLPVVTTASVGAAPLVGPECGIVLSDPEDAAALAEALRTLASAMARRRMGPAARAAAERHSWERMAHAYLALYRELCP